MFCPRCGCEFEGWGEKCPTCKGLLVKSLPPNPEAADEPIPYEALLDQVRENGGRLALELSTVAVGVRRTWGFPYFGYGFAWPKAMRGTSKGVAVQLATTQVGRETRRTFPWRGYGFAWAQEMRGYIGGHQVTLTAKKVGRERSWAFPYFGFGTAWTKALSGSCGGRLLADLSITTVGRTSERRFPWRGYGFAWARWGILTLTVTVEV
jgi:hypothetical protein